MIARRIFVALLLVFFSLRVQAAQWPFPPVAISTPNHNASDPQIAVNGSGDVIAVWVEDAIVYARSADITGTWSVDIDTLSGVGASIPRVVIDSSSTATAAWTENGVVTLASRPLNGSWPATPGTIVSSGATALEMGIDLSGNIVLVWEEADGCIHSATQLVGGSWPVSSDTLSATGASSPHVAMGASGLVVAVWQEQSATSAVYQASKAVAGGWGTPTLVSQTGMNSVYPQIAVDAAGNALAIWFTYNETNGVFSEVVVQAASCPVNGVWATPVAISDAGIRNPADLVSCLAFGVSGQAIALWSSSYNGALFVYEWNVLSNGNWMPVASALQFPNLLAYSCSLATDAKGVAYAVWMAYDASSSTPIIQNSVNDIKSVSGAGFTIPWTLSSSGANGYPVGAVSMYASNVVAVAAWKQFDGANDVIQGVVSVLPVLEPPSGLAVTAVVNNYGITSEITNVVQWLASPSSNISSYVICRDATQIGVVDGTLLQFADCNRSIGETVTYTIYSNDIYVRQSAPAAISFTN